MHYSYIVTKKECRGSTLWDSMFVSHIFFYLMDFQSSQNHYLNSINCCKPFEPLQWPKGISQNISLIVLSLLKVFKVLKPYGWCNCLITSCDIKTQVCNKNI